VTAAGQERSAGGGEVERPLGDAQRTAEEWVDRTIDWATKQVARAREEVEDIWDDANAVRRGE
jgi:hypothetical protein